MRKNILDIYTKAATVLKSISGKVLLIHMIYVVAGMAVFTPIIGFLGSILLHISGQSMLSDMDIAFFALSPIGMTAVTLLGAMLITIIVFEQTSLMALAAGRLQGGDVRIVPALIFTFSRVKDIFLFSLHLISRVLAIVLPFTAVGVAVAWFLLTDYDINYYLAEKPPVFLLAAVLITIVLVVMTVILIKKLLDWAMALPIVLFTDTAAAQSFRESQKLSVGHSRLIVYVFFSWAGTIVILEIVLLGIVQFVGKNFLAMAMGSTSVLVLFLGGLVTLISLANFFVTALSSGSFASLLLVFARRCGLDINAIRVPSLQEIRKTKNKRIRIPQIAFLLACCAAIALTVGLFLLNGVRTEDDVSIIAHRGAAGKAPENTLASVRQALKDGTDWVEVDVQETIDGRIAVIHDSDLMKLAGKDLKIWDATLEQLQQVDIGSWFSPDFSHARIPSLEDVLGAVKGKAKLLIELKYYGHDKMLEQRVTDIVEQEKMVDSVAFMSLKQAGIEKANSLRPEWSYGLLSSKTVGDISSLKMDFLALNMKTTSPGLIRRIHKAGKKVYVWTVNDRISMSRMVSLGVDGIITDEPELARQVLAERAELSSSERLLIHAAVLLGRPIPSKTYRDNSP